MASKQIVTLKGQKDCIVIFIDDKAGFDEVKESLRKKVSQSKNFFDGADTKVAFKGRTLGEYDEKHLIDIITTETSLDITFVQGDDFVAPSSNTPARKKEAPVFPEEAPSPPKQKASAPAPVLAPRGGKRESLTAYYHTGLRSGQSIKYAGSVVIMGDVNPGSEVVADGNVVVLGALKGMAHAGAKGDKSCFVSALLLQPTQLRIAEHISYVHKAAKNVRTAPAYAYVKDGQVFIGPL